MSRSILLSPSFDLIDEIVAQIIEQPGDIQDTLVIFPGKRPAHFLRKNLAARLGRPFIPPKIFSIDNFIEWIYREKLGYNTRSLETIDAVAILYELHKQNRNTFGENHFDLIEDFLPIGLGILNEIEELKIGRVSAKKVRELAGDTMPAKGIQPLLYFYESFYDELEKRNCSTHASEYASCADRIDPAFFAETKKLIIAGFSVLTKSEQAIFSKIATVDRSLFLFQDGPHLEKHIKALGLHPERKETALTAPKISFIMAPDGHGEVFALSSEIVKLQEQVSVLDERNVIVLPDTDNLFPVQNETLAILPEEGYNISLGYPVTRTPVFAFLNSIMDLIVSMYKGQCYSPDYFKLVLHPYTKNIRLLGRSDVTRIMFHTIEERYADDKSMMFFSIGSIEESEILEDVFTRIIEAGIEILETDLKSHLQSIHDNVIHPFVDIANLGDFTQKCVRVLEYIHDNSTANLHIYFRRFVEHIIESLNDISLSSLGGMSLAEPAGYCNFVKRFLEEIRIPFEGTPLHGLQALGFLETRNLKFDRVFILDANDDILPGSRRTDMLLPQQTRELLGLPTYKDREELAAYHFSLLVRGAKEVTCLYIQNDRKEKSRFLEKLLWEQQQQDGKEDTKGYLQCVQYAVSLKNDVPLPIPKTPAMAESLRTMRYNASSLDRYLHCPIRFYHTDVLKLREQGDAAGEIEQKDIGTLVHSILAEYFSKYKNVPLREDLLDPGVLERLIDMEFSKELGVEPAGMKSLLKQQIKTHLKEFLEQYQIPKLQGNSITILDTERRVEASKNSYLFDGFIDRIEKRGSNYFILDYKTGSNADKLKIRFNKLNPDDRASWNEAIGSLQLMFYVLLYSEATGIPEENIIPAFLFLGKNILSEEIEVTLIDADEDRKEKYELLKKVIFKLFEEITSVDSLFNPPDDLKKACPSCPFTYICGTQWVQGWNPG